MKDILGYDREIKTANLASSEFAAITIGSASAKEALIQNVDFQYSQQIGEVVQVGDVNIYLMPGRPSGGCIVSKLVGDGGFFAGFKDGACGVISGVSVDIQPGQCGYVGAGTISFTNGVISALSTSISAAQLQIGNQISIRLASLLSS